MTSMAPEARDCLDVAMERWREFRSQMTIEPNDEGFTFAYWLLRYSGLVVARGGRDGARLRGVEAPAPRDPLPPLRGRLDGRGRAGPRRRAAPPAPARP